MSDVSPYQSDPYLSAGPDAQAYPPAQDGYYGAGYPGAQPDPYPVAPGNQMIPYQAPPQYPYPAAPHGPYGQGMYWAGFYDPRRTEANALGGWALGLGIASMFFGCYLGAIFGIPAIIVGVKGMRAADERRATNKGLSIAGTVLASVATAVNLIFIALVFLTHLNSL